jgi:hypothetical protein
MGPRGVCWDDLPNHFYSRKNASNTIAATPHVQADANDQSVLRPINWKQDSEAVGRRIAFGLVVSISYAPFYQNLVTK